MPRKWIELYPDERLRLCLEFLRLVASRPDLPVGRLREEFAKAHDLTHHAARHIDDILWFSGFITTAYRGIPPRSYRELTPEGRARVEEGVLELRHFEDAPEWVRRSLLWPPRPPVAPQVLRFDHGDFSFWVERDWGYRVYVEGPLRFLHPWQAEFDPDHMRGHGATVPRDTMLYSVKNRAVALLDAMGVQEAAGARRMYQLLGYRWVAMDDRAIAARAAYGVVPSRKRHFIIDPDGKVRVWRLPYLAPDRGRYCVDLTAVAGLPPQIDLVKGKTSLDARVPAGRARFVSKVWE